MKNKKVTNKEIRKKVKEIAHNTEFKEKLKNIKNEIEKNIKEKKPIIFENIENYHYDKD